ncbi:MAG: hypothetical protein Q8P80_04395 [Candidatus Levybacteria bacterium]|nr:hypothetical protein [Candidatus Levybacteria bacterium]
MEEKNQSTENILHNFDSSRKSLFSGKLLMFLSIVVLLGVGTGYLLSKNNTGLSVGGPGGTSNLTGGSSVSKGTVEGSSDMKTNKDNAEGILKEGGIEGEGQFHLVRPGGDSQNVYLTSSNIDLSKFKDRKIKVWGQTQTAQKAGWLMDVGRVEVLE